MADHPRWPHIRDKGQLTGHSLPIPPPAATGSRAAGICQLQLRPEKQDPAPPPWAPPTLAPVTRPEPGAWTYLVVKHRLRVTAFVVALHCQPCELHRVPLQRRSVHGAQAPRRGRQAGPDAGPRRLETLRRELGTPRAERQSLLSRAEEGKTEPLLPQTGLDAC